MSARDAILERIRSATGQEGGGPAEHAAEPRYRVDGELDGAARLALFEERLRDYGVEVERIAEAELAQALAGALAAVGAASVVVPPGFPPAALPPGAEVLADDPEPLTVARLDGAGAVLTGCAVAMAETGTIALDGGPGQGRRALTLVPDVHLCVVRAEQVVQTVPEGMRRLGPSVASGQPITLVSGPSATSDIELRRVSGVHGPRTLRVFLVG